MVVGLDDTFMQQVHASHRYNAGQILWDHRHLDILIELESGDMLLDLRQVSRSPAHEGPPPRRQAPRRTARSDGRRSTVPPPQSKIGAVPTWRRVHQAPLAAFSAGEVNR